MKKYINKSILKDFLIILINIFIIEMIFKIVNFYSLLDWSTLRILISSTIISLIISGILSFLSNKIHKYIIAIFSFIFTIYSLIQTGFNNFIGVYMSFGTSSQLGAVIDYIREFILSFSWYYYFLLLPFIFLILYYIFLNKKIDNKFNIICNKYKLKKLLERICIYIIGICIIGSIYYSTLVIPFIQPKLQTITNKKLFKNPSVPSISIKQFGIIVYGLLDVKNYINPSETILDVNYEENKQNNANTLLSRKFDDTAWNKLINKETNVKLNNLNNYFINQSITDTNEYTGLFENKNLIVIMLESVNDIIINEKDYPNFYKMYSKGWHWKNNYSPRNSCSTGNNEMSGMISLYSIYNTCTANNYKENTYFESIFNLFNNKNYNTFSAHDYTEHYYYRNEIHTNMGSKKYYGVDDLGIDYRTEYKNWASDEDFMTKILDIINNNDDKQFMSWLTTVSSHQPYYYSSIEGDKYLSLYENENIRTDLKRYKSKLKIVDNALGILLDGLESKGILDDTVIVMYGDHYPYGLSTSTLNTVLNYDTKEDYESERVPFVIYNNKQESKEFNEYTSYINLLPTIANLFNLNYDPRLYLGSDLLSNDYKSLVVFADGSWKNEVAYYDASTSNIKYYNDKTYTNDEIIKINNMIDAKMKMSSLAIKNNYFNYLYKNIDEFKSVEN